MNLDIHLAGLKQAFEELDWLKDAELKIQSQQINLQTISHPSRNSEPDIRIVEDEDGLVTLVNDNQENQTIEADQISIDVDEGSSFTLSESLLDQITISIEDEVEIHNSDDVEEIVRLPEEFDEGAVIAQVLEGKRSIEKGLHQINNLQKDQKRLLNQLSDQLEALDAEYRQKVQNAQEQLSAENGNFLNKQAQFVKSIRQAHSDLQNATDDPSWEILRWLYDIFTDRRQRISAIQQILNSENAKQQVEGATHQQMVDLLQGSLRDLQEEYQQRRDKLQRDANNSQRVIVQQFQVMHNQLAQTNLPRLYDLIDQWIQFLTDWLIARHIVLDENKIQFITPRSLSDNRDIENVGLRIGYIQHHLRQTDLEIPAVIDPFGHDRHVFITGPDNNLKTNMLKMLAARLIITIPVGLARITLIDGLELGRSVAIFSSRLPEDLVSKRVLNLEQEVTEELMRLRERIAQINQHILVEEDHIDSYNRKHPEIPCPYQFIVINNFPHGLNSQGLAALRDILRNGPRAGIFVLATLASNISDRRDFVLSDYTDNQYLLSIGTDNLLCWNSEYLSNFRVVRDEPVSDTALGTLLSIANKAYEIRPLVIPYERIARDLPQLWSLSADTSLKTIIGLTFAGKTHVIEFGDETVHGLIGGRTGSGKTVLIHDLICGLIQAYHPNELELYLLDFKGTEFNVYARNEIPHLRTVAVDCDIEVGLNVIKHLIDEMNRRFKLFDEVEVNDYRHYRAKGKQLSRIVLVVDEIQVLTQYLDNRISAQIETSLIDLLKRGRAAGIHVMMGTQSPSSVLSNQILQQIAIRICLLADQSVSRLVLGESNTAASGLQKQGEAVFNAYNGNPQHNVFVRSALLETEHIGDIAKRLALQAKTSGWIAPAPMDYFDGRTITRLLDNQEVKASQNAVKDPVTLRKVNLPLGKSLSLKEDTQAIVNRERYNNLLLVGLESEVLHNLFHNVLLSLFILSPVETDFFIIDLCSEDVVSHSLTQAFSAMPHCQQFGYNSATGADMIKGLYRVFKDRKEGDRKTRRSDPAVILAIFGMENFSDMRGADRFSKPEERKQLEEIIKEGPPLGIFTIIASQILGKGEVIGADEFGNRVCFQLAEDDSRALLENDAATKLRAERGIFRRREWAIGRLEKFIPYQALSQTEVEQVADRLGKRANSGQPK